MEFGERVFSRRVKLSKNKLEARWDEGIFLGIDWRTGAAHVADNDGVTEAHAIKRGPVDVRWKPELIEKNTRVPMETKESRRRR